MKQDNVLKLTWHYISEDKIAEGIATLNDAISSEPNEDYLILLGWLYFYSDSIPKSHDVFNELVVRNLVPYESHMGLAYCLRKSGKYADASKILVRSLNYLSHGWQRHMVIGYLASYEGDNKKSFDHFSYAYEIFPSDPRIAAAYGASALLNGKNQEAVDALQLASQNPLKIFDTFYNLGVAQQRTGKHNMSLESYTVALSIDPDNDLCLRAMIALCLRRGKLISAFKFARIFFTLRIENGRPINF